MDNAAIFLNELAMINGIVASIGYPEANDKPAKFLIPLWNLVNNDAGSMFITFSGRMAPSS